MWKFLTGRFWITLTLVLCLSAAATQAADRQAPETKLTVGTNLTGTVSDSLGNVLAQTELTFEGVEPVQVVSDEEGRFAVELEPGEYDLVLGPKLRMPVEVSQASEVEELVVIMPGAYSAADIGNPLTKSFWTTGWTARKIAVVTVVAVLLIGGGVALASSGGSSSSSSQGGTSSP